MSIKIKSKEDKITNSDKSFKKKIKLNKNEIVIVCFSGLVVIGLTLYIKKKYFVNTSEINYLHNNNLIKNDSIKKTGYNITTSSVSRHIRNLPIGWKTSLKKIEEAKNLGIDLEPNQTWVIDYTKSLIN